MKYEVGQWLGDYQITGVTSFDTESLYDLESGPNCLWQTVFTCSEEELDELREVLSLG